MLDRQVFLVLHLVTYLEQQGNGDAGELGGGMISDGGVPIFTGLVAFLLLTVHSQIFKLNVILYHF